MKVWELVEKLAKLGMDNEVYIYPKMEGPLTVPQVHLAGDSNKQVVVVSMTGDLEHGQGGQGSAGVDIRPTLLISQARRA